MSEKITIEEVDGQIVFNNGIEVIEFGSDAIEIIDIAEQGPAGPPGPSSDVVLDGYTHTQASPASTWTINHNLGRRPIVTLLTTGAVEFEGQLTHLSNNQAVVNLATAVAGTARCL